MPNEYYRTKHVKRTADLKPYVALLLIFGCVVAGVLIVGWLGWLCYEDGVRVAKDEVDIAQLTQAQRSEVMSRMTTRVTGRRAVSAVRVDPLVSPILLEDL